MKNQLRISYPKLYAVISTLLLVAAWIAVYFYMDAWAFLVVGVVYICILLCVLFFRLDFHPEEMEVRYLPLCHRHIAAHRISTIQLVSIGSIPTLIICIDGHRPYNEFLEFSFFHLSFKVIRMQLIVSQETCEKYAEALKALYGDKFIIGESYRKHIQKNKSK